MFIGVRPGWTALDVSTGGGYTTELLARAIGPTALVWAQSQPRDPNQAHAQAGRARRRRRGPAAARPRRRRAPPPTCSPTRRAAMQAAGVRRRAASPTSRSASTTRCRPRWPTASWTSSR